VLPPLSSQTRETQDASTRRVFARLRPHDSSFEAGREKSNKVQGKLNSIGIARPGTEALNMFLTASGATKVAPCQRSRAPYQRKSRIWSFSANCEAPLFQSQANAHDYLCLRTKYAGSIGTLMLSDLYTSGYSRNIEAAIFLKGWRL
jgi:hypothetical protein